MRHDDAELEQMRAGVSCAVLLERAGYELDKAESTRKCLKYRRGSGEIVIVNHDGRGWWDPMRPGSEGRAGEPRFLANHAGGIAGGIATGQPIRLRVAFKPTSSILTPVETVTRAGEPTTIATRGRHDPCVGIRGAPVVEAMVALVLADQALLHRAQCGSALGTGLPPIR